MENQDQKRVVEIEGVKLEIDLRTAKRVECFKVGDNVKVLKKRYSDYVSYPGVIVGFDDFKKLPTIVIAYVDIGYDKAAVEFAFLNAESKDIEVCPMVDEQNIIEKQRAVDMMERAIEVKQREIEDLKMKKNYFLENFNTYLEP